MSTTTETLATLPWSSDVSEFATANGLAQTLPKMLGATKSIFPTAKSIQVYMDEDAETAGEWQIIIDVVVAGINGDEGFEAQQNWNDALRVSCPYGVAPRICLCLERR